MFREKKLTKEEVVSIDTLQECFEYKSGKLYWKERPPHHFVNDFHYQRHLREQVGRLAGRVNARGYRTVCISSFPIQAHRIVLMLHGVSIPSGMVVDHINGDKLDNRLENLKVCTQAENTRNALKLHNNTSGVNGVTWIEARQKWMVRIGGDRGGQNRKYLGIYSSFDEAVAVRKNAEEELNFSNRHGT